ncbi:MAG TPA: single-stranded DNA-binding protein, partial [Thermoflexia bacterium]|nr:single-stranded DNA-binding protein [Thermoflexia bacterium]
RMKGGKEETVVEVVVGDEIDFLSKIKWETGNAARKRILAEHEEDTSGLPRPPYGGFIRVVAFHDLALFAYPYLQVGSLLFVRGRLQARKRQLANGKRKTVVEVVAKDITFLRDTDKERGNAARDRILEARKRGADV